MLGIRRLNGTAIDLWQGDITEFVCDAMVNAANHRLSGGGGVDGAIHRVGGPTILKECEAIGECPTGEAVITGAGNLPSTFVIHAVGPVWQGGGHGEDQLLASAYQKSLKLAEAKSCRHIAFPAISTGAYHYPVERAAKVTFKALREYLEKRGSKGGVKRISIVLYSLNAYHVFQEALFNEIPDLT